MQKLVCLALISTAVICHGDYTTPPSALFQNFSRSPAPNASLPAYIVAKEGALTLFADFDHPDPQGIPLYLVNRTSKSIPLESKSELIKLQVFMPASGQWQRAQAHQFSDCGTYLYTAYLPSGMHCRRFGYRPTDGHPAKVRYTSYDTSLPLVSNEGSGLYLEQDVKDSRIDRLSLTNVPSTISNAFHPEYPPHDLSLSGRVALLHMASLIGEIPAIRAEAENWAAQLAATTGITPEQWVAEPMVKAILQKDWGPQQGLHRLLAQCQAVITRPPATVGTFGSMDKERTLVCNVVGEIARIELATQGPGMSPANTGIWDDLLRLAVQTELAPPNNEPSPLGSLLSLAPLVDERLPDKIFETLLAQSTKPWVVHQASHTLARRSQWERAADIGLHLKPASQIILLSALAGGLSDIATPATSRDPLNTGPIEVSFWHQVLAAQPVPSAAALASYVTYGDSADNPFMRSHFEALLSHWQAEADRTTRDPKSFDLGPDSRDHERSLDFIAAWRNPDDLSLFRALLSHGGYARQTIEHPIPGSNIVESLEHHDFIIRRSAARALQSQHQPVPANIIFEENIPLPPAKDSK